MKRPWDAIIWWEVRRIPFNILLLVVGLISGMVVMLAGEHRFEPDVDFGHPFIGALLYAFGANICYTLGWATELAWFGGDTSLSEKRRTRVFRAGLIFSVALTLLPAIIIPLAWALEKIH